MAALLWNQWQASPGIRDQDVMLYLKRYSYELIKRQKWRHYLSDISVFVELIDRVMRDVPR